MRRVLAVLGILVTVGSTHLEAQLRSVQEVRSAVQRTQTEVRNTTPAERPIRISLVNTVLLKDPLLFSDKKAQDSVTTLLQPLKSTRLLEDKEALIAELSKIDGSLCRMIVGCARPDPVESVVTRPAPSTPPPPSASQSSSVTPTLRPVTNSPLQEQIRSAQALRSLGLRVMSKLVDLPGPQNKEARVRLVRDTLLNARISINNRAFMDRFVIWRDGFLAQLDIVANDRAQLEERIRSSLDELLCASYVAKDDEALIPRCQAVGLPEPVVVTGPVGPPGVPGRDAVGISCWDLNHNRVADPDEDTDRSGKVDVLDCRGTIVEQVKLVNRGFPTKEVVIGVGTALAIAGLVCLAIEWRTDNCPSDGDRIDIDIYNESRRESKGMTLFTLFNFRGALPGH